MKENCYFVALWDHKYPDFEHWVRFDLMSYDKACALVERVRALSPRYGGAVVEAFLGEAWQRNNIGAGVATPVSTSTGYTDSGTRGLGTSATSTRR